MSGCKHSRPACESCYVDKPTTIIGNDPTPNQAGSDAIDKIILDVAHAASMMQRGKTISAAMFPEARQAIQAEITRARLEERDHAWNLVNDIRYQKITLIEARDITLERLTDMQVEQQLQEESKAQATQEES